ncbi:DUF397 domain-containing protein [Streptomyces sp. NPDC003077]|uniref:DUF397 domain-containing protein n=1 Tax=Streptomyces sp. NPDC003077 TaxID=3154443 RepID=UPI0033BACAD9
MRILARDQVWSKSSYSGAGGNCVEVAHGVCEGVSVRDSKAPEGDVLVFRSGNWEDFLRGVKSGSLF